MRSGWLLSGQRLSTADEQSEEAATVWRAGQLREALDATETEDAEVSGTLYYYLYIYSLYHMYIFRLLTLFWYLTLSLVGIRRVSEERANTIAR